MRAGKRLKIKLGFESEKERKKRVAREKKEIEKNNNYFKSLSTIKTKIEPHLNTDVFKEVLWKEGKDYFNKMHREFTVDENNRDFLNLISLYFSKNIEFEKITDGELRKGLLIHGVCGTGKSSIFDIVQNISRKHNLKSIWFKNISVHQVTTDYNIEGEDVVKKYSRGVIHFDDLGTEKMANSWGVKERLMGRVLEIRYNEFKTNGTRTFVTTNLSLNELKKYYGDRVYDRLFEMFNFLELAGESRRF